MLVYWLKENFCFNQADCSSSISFSNIQLSPICLQLWKEYKHIFRVFSRKQEFQVTRLNTLFHDNLIFRWVLSCLSVKRKFVFLIKKIVPLPFLHPTFKFLPLVECVLSTNREKNTFQAHLSCVFEKTRVIRLHTCTFARKTKYQATNVFKKSKIVTFATCT